MTDEERFARIERDVRDVKIAVFGFDGHNGMRGELRDLRLEMEEQRKQREAEREERERELTTREKEGRERAVGISIALGSMLMALIGTVVALIVVVVQ